MNSNRLTVITLSVASGMLLMWGMDHILLVKAVSQGVVEIKEGGADLSATTGYVICSVGVWLLLFALDQSQSEKPGLFARMFGKGESR